MSVIPHDFIGISGNTWWKEPSKVRASSPCYLRQLFYSNPLESWSSFTIKPIRLLPATHSSCWRLSQSFPPLLAANLPAFKQNLLRGIHPSSLSECTILIQLGEEAEDGGASLHSFCCTNLGEHSPGVAQLSVPAFPPLFAGSSLRYWALCYFIASLPSKITYFFYRQSYFLIARLISGQLAAWNNVYFLSKISDSPQAVHSWWGTGSPGQTWTWLNALSSNVKRKLGSFCLMAPECYAPLTCRINHSSCI